MGTIQSYSRIENFDTLCSKSESAKIFSQLKIPIFPVHCAISDVQCSCGTSGCSSVGKHPRTQNGFKGASYNLDQIAEWWSRWPNANIGVRTGLASGLVVLDEDPRNGGRESLIALENEIGKLPPTWLSHTGGGGRHFCFQSPNDPLNGRTNFKAGLDFKAEGGYVIAPPSDHKSGAYYSWDDDFNPSTVALAPLPMPLLRLLKSNTTAQPKGKWREEIEKKITEGSRNTTMTRVVGGFLRAGIHPRDLYEFIKFLNEKNFDPPLPSEELERILFSIMSREIKRRAGGF